MQHIISNWFLADIDSDSLFGVRVALSQTDGATVCGELDGQLVAMTGIADFGPDHIVTNGDTRYRLGEIHPDYNEMLLAKSRRIPILDYWDMIEVDDLFDDQSGICLHMEWNKFVDLYNERSHHKGYLLSGICNNTIIEGEIIAQRGNYVALKYHNPYYGVSSNLSMFVIWPNVGVSTAKKLENGQFTKEMSVARVEECFSMDCRPIIQKLYY